MDRHPHSALFPFPLSVSVHGRTHAKNIWLCGYQMYVLCSARFGRCVWEANSKMKTIHLGYFVVRCGSLRVCGSLKVCGLLRLC